MDERTQQVSIMDKIYKAGDKVLIWLGDEGPGTQLALAKLDQIGQARTAAEADQRNLLTDLYQRARKAKRELGRYWGEGKLVTLKKEKDSALENLRTPDVDLLELENGPLWQGIVELFARSYWNRL